MNIELPPPPPIISHFEYPELEQVTRDDGVRHYGCPDGGYYPSVTTILGGTADKSHIESWKKAVGEKKANKTRDEAGAIGTVMHRHLEWYLRGEERRYGSNVVQKIGSNLANNIIRKGLVHVDEVWGIESPLYLPGLYAGTADLIGLYKGRPAIMDFKNARKARTRDMIGDYFCQLASYALAHNTLFNTEIETGVIFMCVRDLVEEKKGVNQLMENELEHEFLIFEVTGDDFHKSKNEFLDRVQAYYEKIAA